MHILVWHPVYVLGGGLEVLRSMVAALGRQPAVDAITLAVNHRYSPEALAPLAAVPGLTTVRVDTTTGLAAHASGHDVAYMPWPHGAPRTPAPLPKLCVFQDTILLDALGGHATRGFLEEMARGLRETVDYYDHLIVTSNYTRRRIIEIAGRITANRISVLPHMASAPVGVPSLEAPLPAGIRRPYVLYLANAAEHKNHETLLQALTYRQRRDVPIVFCGYGTEQIGVSALVEEAHLNRINRLICDRGLRPWQDFCSLGYVDDPTAGSLLRRAAALVMPTRAEGMGLPIHDAIDARVPVICSDLEVLREHYDARSRAIRWVDPESPADIASAIDDVVTHTEEWRTAAERNRGSGRTWDDIAAATVTLLQDVIHAYDPGPAVSRGELSTRRWGRVAAPFRLRRFFRTFGRLRSRGGQDGLDP